MTTPLNAAANHPAGNVDERSYSLNRLAMPFALRVSLLTQFFAIGLIVAASLNAGRTAVILPGLLAMAAVVLIAGRLASGSYQFWRGAILCAFVGIVILIGLTVAAAIRSPAYGLIGVFACAMQIQYLIALTSLRTRRFFSGRLPSGDTVDAPAELQPTTKQHLTQPGRSRPTTIGRLCLVLLMMGGSMCCADNPPQPALEDLLVKIPDEFSPQRDNVEKRLKRYRDFSGANKIAAQKELTVRLNNAAQTTGPESHETLAVQATLDWLNNGGSPPSNADDIMWIVGYAESVAKQQAFVWRHLAILMTKLAKAGHQDEAAMLHTAFLRLEAHHKDSENLLRGRLFKGYRTSTNGKHTISLSVKFSELSDSDEQFVGRLERDFMYKGHPVHNLTGQFVGGNVMIQTGSVLAFGSKSDHAWTYSGCLIGRSLIGRYAGRDKKGKPMGGAFHLRTGK